MLSMDELRIHAMDEQKTASKLGTSRTAKTIREKYINRC